MNVARFIAFCGKLEYGRSGCIFAYISMTTRARDFKFAGTPVQRLQLAMVALTQKSFSAQYAWFSRGGSHISKNTPGLPVLKFSRKRNETFYIREGSALRIRSVTHTTSLNFTSAVA